MYEIISNYLVKEFGLWGVITFLFVILFPPILITVISRILEIEFFTNRLIKNKNKIWIKIIRNNKSISQCLYEYNQLKSSMGISQFSLIVLGLFVGIAAPFLLLFVFGILKNVIQFDYSFIFALSLSNLISSFVAFVLAIQLKNRVESINHTKLELEFKHFNNLFIFSIFYSLTLAEIILVVYVEFLIPSELEFNLNNVMIMNIITFMFILVSIIGLIISKRRFLDLIKTAFNKKWFEKFPNLCITTSGGVQIDGIVNDAFNTDYIILNKKGNEIIILWSSVASIEFQSDKYKEAYTFLDLPFY